MEVALSIRVSFICYGCSCVQNGRRLFSGRKVREQQVRGSVCHALAVPDGADLRQRSVHFGMSKQQELPADGVLHQQQVSRYRRGKLGGNKKFSKIDADCRSRSVQKEGCLRPERDL